jgi:hypothetical protein
MKNKASMLLPFPERGGEWRFYQPQDFHAAAIARAREPAATRSVKFRSASDSPERPRDAMTITINNELLQYIDPLTANEYAALERSLLAEGCRDALVLWGDVLVDGHKTPASIRSTTSCCG